MPVKGHLLLAVPGPKCSGSPLGENSVHATKHDVGPFMLQHCVWSAVQSMLTLLQDGAGHRGGLDDLLQSHDSLCDGAASHCAAVLGCGRHLGSQAAVLLASQRHLSRRRLRRAQVDV